MRQDRPSSTARLISESILLLSREPALRPLITDRAVQLQETIVRSWGRGPVFFWVIGISFFRKLFLGVEGFVLPGMFLQYVVRKRYLERIARTALRDEKTSQLVFLGAGFDTLGLRLAEEFSEALFVELDHPATQAMKRNSLSGIAIPKNLEMHPLDLMSGDLRAVLAQIEGFDFRRRTLFVAEGVLMYLSPAKIDDLFASLRSLTPAGSRFVFSFMAIQESGRIGFRVAHPVVDAWLRRKSEPFTWGLDPAATEKFLEQRGFRQVELLDHREFRRRELNGIDERSYLLAEGELYCLSESTQASS